jgi:hypothetical protein
VKANHLSHDPYSPNPFAHDPQPTNPYASPPPAAGWVGATFEQASRQLKAPAIILLVMSILTILYRLFDLAFSAYSLTTPELQPPQHAMFIGAVVADTIAIVLSILTIYGSLAMLRLTSLSAARTAAIISVIPLCAPCLILGIPFGIWALVVLSRPEVAAAFQGQR